MIGYSIPLERYPDTYNGEPLGLAGLASQKRYMALYLMGVYGDAQQGSWFRSRWESTGKPLDMGKSCVRFRRLEDVPLEVVGEAIARTSVDELVALYERSRDDPPPLRRRLVGRARVRVTTWTQSRTSDTRRCSSSWTERAC